MREGREGDGEESEGETVVEWGEGAVLERGEGAPGNSSVPSKRAAARGS